MLLDIMTLLKSKNVWIPQEKITLKYKKYDDCLHFCRAQRYLDY
ncbi:hypothetical protein CCAND93_60004 [Capnocytophaga canis]|uniref:Uncharacterized protein n=1 Tax=Capnocytophaga canis TaxID=1848903 RepID=A0A0B7ITA2_9FLAO|nr:hypothetical protein CCAND93_60004 [Capnocytophaga canis]